MLWRYLPELEDTTTGAWTRPRHAKARALVRRLIEAHDAELPARRPHAELIALAGEPLAQAELGESLQRGWTLAFDSRIAQGGVADAGDADRAAGDVAGGAGGEGGRAPVRRGDGSSPRGDGD